MRRAPPRARSTNGATRCTSPAETARSTSRCGRCLQPVPGLTAIPIGIIPLGTGNDFAKALGLGDDPDGALETLLAARVVDVDVGTVNGRPFVNTSAGGFVADVTEVVTEGLKDVTGKLAYLIGGARALLGSEPFAARLTLPGGAGRGHGWAGDVELQMFAICNARFIGGGYPIAPAALIDDGLLDVFLVKRMPLLEFVRVLQTIAAGEHQDDERVLHFRASAFDLEFDRVVRVNTDGELLQAASCHYRVRPRCGGSSAARSRLPAAKCDTGLIRTEHVRSQHPVAFPRAIRIGDLALPAGRRGSLRRRAQARSR